MGPGESHRERRHTHRYNAEAQVKRQAERGVRETVKRRIGCRNVLSRVTVGVDAVSQSHISRAHCETCQLEPLKSCASLRASLEDGARAWHGAGGEPVGKFEHGMA